MTTAEQPEGSPGNVSDPAAWRALSHPARVDILVELQRLGRARAADLAPLTGIPSNRVSFHLKQLARYGYVEETSDEGGDRRERWWMPTNREGFVLGGVDDLSPHDDRQAAAVAANALRNRAINFLDLWFESALSAGEDPPTQSSIEMTMRLDADQYRSMVQELVAVLERWREAGERPPHEGRRHVRFVAFARSE